ncbi:hypothetical protein [Saccharopolyspora rosea]|uniref:Uncharacterized protein n=1 Tax=Saccharopolyspora rosea TaxID=524884 RepID=A0ABW3FZC7_9PSEU|nr:hypothetical protein [Saccharopolyspora rosea]
MSTRTKGLAVLLRRAQWLLGDLAFHVGAGSFRDRDVEDVCALLEEVVRMLRENKSSTQDRTRSPEAGPPLDVQRRVRDGLRRL